MSAVARPTALSAAFLVLDRKVLYFVYVISLISSMLRITIDAIHDKFIKRSFTAQN